MPKTDARVGSRPARGPTALVLGSITRDVEAGGRSSPGGVVHYAGLAFAALGARTRVVTRSRREDAAELLAPLRTAGVDTRALASAKTTTYANDYTGEEDRHELLAASDPIAPADLPQAWRSADAVHLGPLHRRDLLPESVAVLRGLVGIDLQGLARLGSPAGTRLAANLELKDFLAHVSVAKAAEEEIAALLEGMALGEFRRAYGLDELLVTRGARGAVLVTQNGVEEIPAVPAVKRFPTGAGDVFLAAYLFARASGREARASASFAARASSAQIEHGALPPGFALEPPG
ncbi:MAG TPA: PfkB family carbohydrate kinase [Myxococcota bacterium]|nr:PfkB family carbohydrate kinase [Myxococcota bacterium]